MLSKPNSANSGITYKLSKSIMNKECTASEYNLILINI